MQSFRSDIFNSDGMKNCSDPHPQHLVEVVVLQPCGVQQVGAQEQPGVGPQPQHLQKQSQQQPHLHYHRKHVKAELHI